MTATTTFYAHGKLMLSGEYFTLEGAKALALPTKFGQTLQIKNTSNEGLHWIGLLPNGSVWLDVKMSLPDLALIEANDVEVANRLIAFLKAAKTLNAYFLKDIASIQATTQLEFEREWGLGSSSTVLSLIAQWAQVNPFQLLELASNGSGYDVACATADGAILYQNYLGNKQIESVVVSPTFKDQLLFVHLGKKQDTRQAIDYFKAQAGNWKTEITQVTEISEAISTAATLTEWQSLMQTEENLVSTALKLTTVKQLYFNDFAGVVRSLGAWGGDFVLAIADQPIENTIEYFKTKGYHTMFRWDELILQQQ